MKNPFCFSKTILLPAFLLFTGLLSAQTDNDPPASYHYKLVVEAAIYECDILGNRVAPTTLYEAPAHAVFSKIGETGDNFVIIRFWKWKDVNPDKQLLLNYTDSTQQNRKYFLISQADFTAKAIMRYPTHASFSAGTIVVPVKARFDQFDFSTDTHLGPSVGARFRLSPYTNSNFFNVLTTFGVSTIGLDSLSTQGAVAQPTDRPAITFTLGGVFQFSNAQVGFFLGWDYISRNTTEKWIYQGKPWISIGLGYAIMSQDAGQQPGSEGRN